MKIKKESLVIKIILYNDIAIFVTAILIAVVIIISSFQQMEKTLENRTKNKLNFLINNYKGYFTRTKEEVYKELNKNEFEKNSAKIIAEKIRDGLLESNFKEYYNIVVSIVSSDKVLLGESGNKNDLGTLTESNIEKLIEKLQEKEVEKKGYYLTNVQNKIYSRVIIPYRTNNQLYYVILTIPINSDFLKQLKDGLTLTSNDKLLFLINTDYNKELQSKKFFSPETYMKKTKNEYQTFYSNKKIDGISYSVGVFNLVGNRNDYLGSFLIGLSKKNIIRETILSSLYVAFLIFVLMAITSSIATKILKKMLLPLEEISDIANKVSVGEKVENINIVGKGEIRTLSIAFKEMLEKLNIAQEKLGNRNIELLKNISRIKAIDKLLMGINIEKDTYETIKKLVLGFTSEVGLGYARAIYFRYSRENEFFIGDYFSINSSLNEESKKGFKFQINDLKNLVMFTKIPLSDDNLFSKAFKEEKIFFENDLGYKYNLGNDLLKAIGLKNFFIFPIYGAGKYSGVILVDNYTKNIKINKEELELLNLLSINFSIGISNRERIINTIDDERVITIKKLASRFYKLKYKVADKLLKYIDSNDSPELKSENLIRNILEIRPHLVKIKDETILLEEYTEEKNIKKSKISIEKIINEIIEKESPKFESENIAISFFSSTEGFILGNKIEFEKIIEELLKNSYYALLEKIDNRKINIILTKKRGSEKFELKIIDTGIGMTKEQLKNIYEPFIRYRAQTLGLGLFLVQKVIKNYDGVIKHYSELGKGTEVRITLNIYKEEL